VCFTWRNGRAFSISTLNEKKTEYIIGEMVHAKIPHTPLFVFDSVQRACDFYQVSIRYSSDALYRAEYERAYKCPKVMINILDIDKISSNGLVKIWREIKRTGKLYNYDTEPLPSGMMLVTGVKLLERVNWIGDEARENPLQELWEKE
jgi:hypothetical protein